MKKEPLISVIVPIYNVEKYLEKCIESIINQSYSNIEVILIVDGSPDKSIDICNKYKEIDKRIKVIEKENGGVSSARNVGIKEMRGEYCVCIDSDDWIHQDMLKTLYDNMVNFDADMSVCNFYTESDDDVRNKKDFSGKIEELDVDKALEYLILPDKFYGFPWNKMYKKSVIKDMTFNEDIIKGEDSLFACEYILRCKKIVYHNEPLYYYRIDSISASRSKFNINKMTVLVAYERMIELIKIYNNKCYLVELQRVQYANQLLSLLTNILSTDVKIYSEQKKIIVKEMKKYIKLYLHSKNIDFVHKISYVIGTYCLFVLRILCKIKNVF